MDAEWVELMKLAKSIGLTIEEVREFLQREAPRQRVAE
jgi:DNA-binding transcriptional MerR regulator